MEWANMQITPEQGGFLRFLVETIQAQRIIEIGVFTGYSTLAMALSLLKDGRIIACEINEEWMKIAKYYWRKARVNKKIDARVGPALDALNELITSGSAGTFDLICIDADKTNHSLYVEKCYRLLRPGGIIVIDNFFWGGCVVDNSFQDVETRAIRSLNKKLAKDDRFTMSVVPISDGITLLRKRN
jgi:caffeoyl-CoA O-methyltransferase